MAKLIFLGSSSGQTAKYETVSFILITDNEERILVETGPSVVKQIERAGFNPSDIDALAISHCHGDHTLGYPYFMFVNHVNRISGKKGRQRVKVLATREVHEGLQNMLSFCYPPGKWQTFEIEKIDLIGSPKGTLFESVTYNTARVKHSVPNRAFSFSFDNKKITYSSDTVYCKEIVELAQGSDILIQEAMVPNKLKEFSEKTKHATTGDAARIAYESGVSRVILVHIDPPWFDNEEYLINEVKKEFQGDVSIAHEFDEILF